MTTQPQTPLIGQVGETIGGYRLTRYLGRGGMGVVYQAEDLNLGRQVAIKLLAPELAQDESFKRRFESESRLAAAIDHPNVIPLYQAGEADGLLFIAMRLVVGSDLRELLAREGPLPAPRALNLIRQIGAALDAAHASDLVHRDVKPGNVLLTQQDGDEHCYLTDFGLTRRISSDTGLTVSGHFVGTIDYIAPEQIEGKRVDGRADQYSLACLFYEMLTGTPPYRRETDVAVLWAHMNEAPPKVAAGRPDVNPAIDEVLAHALAKKPRQRFESCRELVQAATAALQSGTVPTIVEGPALPDAMTVADTPATAQIQPEPRRRWRLTVVIAAVLGVIALAGGAAAAAVLLLSPDEESSPATTASTPSAAAPVPDRRSEPAGVVNPPACSASAAEKELRRKGQFDPASFDGVKRVICQDFTDDGADDMAFIRESNGSAGVVGWGIFVAQSNGKWDQALFRPDESRIGLRPVDGGIQRATPRYLPEEPLCCPTGGYDIEEFAYRKGEFKVVRSWIDPDQAPPGGFGWGSGASE